MKGRGLRILLIGGSYRALCVLERLLERGERIVASIGHEGEAERDFCAEILETCDRCSIPARSGRKLGEEMVRWLEDRIRPELAIAVGVRTEIPLAIGGNCRAGLVEVVDRLHERGAPAVLVQQKGQTLVEQPVDPQVLDDPEALYVALIDATVAAIESYLNGLTTLARPPEIDVPYAGPGLDATALAALASDPEPGRSTLEVEHYAAESLDAERVLALRSHADAFELLAHALGLRPGDSVLAPPLVSASALEGLQRAGVHPVFGDVRKDRLTLDPSRLEDACLEGVRALLIAHAFGQAAELGALYAEAERLGLEVIEDGGEAWGARVGGSRVGGRRCTCAFRVPLAEGSAEEATLLALPAGLLKRLRGSDAVLDGLRLGNAGASLLCARLLRWDDHLSALRQCASRYSAELSRYDAFVVPATPPDAHPTYAQYVLRLTRFARTTAEDLHKLLAEEGVETHRIQPVCSERELVALPVTEAAAASAVLLPVRETLAATLVDHILDTIFDYAIG